MKFDYDAEKTSVMASHYKEIIKTLGEDVDREGMQKTPERVAKAMQYLTKGYQQDPKDILLGALFKENYRQMVIVKDIHFYSLCEHHMIPFFGKAHVAYIPNGYITGTRSGCVCPSIAGSRTPHNSNKRSHTNHFKPTRGNGGNRSAAYVHANAWCRETKLYNHYIRFHRYF